MSEGQTRGPGLTCAADFGAGSHPRTTAAPSSPDRGSDPIEYLSQLTVIAGKIRHLVNAITPMTIHFLPRDRQFWVYHCSAIAVGLAVTISMALAWSFLPSYQVASSIVWVPLYTLAVLGFRWLYLRLDGRSASMGKLIAASVAYSALTGAIIATVLQASIVPFYWDGFLAKYARAGMPLVYKDFLLNSIRGDAPQNQMFVLVWSFIYISVTGNRHVKRTELFNLRLQNNLKDAQLSSLANQLNPHFLFNSLNNIRFMIHEDARRADVMITSFSEILRYSLDSSKCEKIDLGSEMAIIGNYLDIVEIQLEDRLRCTLAVGPELQAATVPPMMLHMLVENAIKHGLEQLPAGGHLAIEAAQSGGQLVLVVSNDTPPTQSARPGMGIGLRNIAQRLALLYGERAALNVQPGEGRFIVTLTLPLEYTA